MLPHILGITLFGSLKPYFRKHVLNTLDSRDFLFVNALLIATLICGMFLYTYFFENHALKKTYRNCCDLSYTQLGSLLLIAAFTVFSSFLIIDMDKNFNTPFVNYVIIKALSMVALLLVGILLFSESYNHYQIVGISLTVAGIAILYMNPVESK